MTMSSLPVHVAGCGLVSAVGFDAHATAAAVRAKAPHVVETAFQVAGEPLFAAQMPLPDGLRGLAKVRLLLGCAAAESLHDAGLVADVSPLLVFVAVADRPGAILPDDATLLAGLAEDCGRPLDPRSQVLRLGRWAGTEALIRARDAIRAGAGQALVAAYDSLLTGPTVNQLAVESRLITPANPDGFIPGEAAAAILLSSTASASAPRLAGLGVGTETVLRESDGRLRGDGLSAAMGVALAEAGLGLHEVGWRMAGVCGDQYDFAEAAAAIGRTLRVVRPRFEAWTPLDCLGEIGAATLPALLVLAVQAFRRGYAPGSSVLAHLGADGPERGAVVLVRAEAA